MILSIEMIFGKDNLGGMRFLLIELKIDSNIKNNIAFDSVLLFQSQLKLVCSVFMSIDREVIGTSALDAPGQETPFFDVKSTER